MKPYLSISLSIIAVLLAGWSLVKSSAHASKTDKEKPAAVLSAAPASEPELAGKCGELKPVTGLGDLMMNRVNPAMTRIAFSLHHDRREIDTRLEVVAACAAQIVDAVGHAPGYKPDIPFEALPEYYRGLESLRTNALAIKNAALEMAEGEAQHWYSHAKQDCIACHARTRVN